MTTPIKSPKDIFGDFFVKAAVALQLLEALKSCYLSIENWSITGQTQNAEESQALTKKVRDAILAADPSFIDSRFVDDISDCINITQFTHVYITDANDKAIPNVKICNLETGFVIREESINGTTTRLREIHPAPLNILVSVK